MLFSRPYVYEPCGIFTKEHFFLITITIIGIIIALRNTTIRSKKEVKNIIKKLTLIMCFLEVIRILFNLYVNGIKEVGTYMPLYYCSLMLYAGLLSSFSKGKYERMGNVFLATGGIIGGIVFLIFPTTSLPTYPMLHFLSLHSFLYHGTMIYIGLLINKTNYINIEKKDIIYFAPLVFIISMVALVINNIFDSNLMFISKDFPKTPITLIYKATGKLFTPIMIISQMILPFIIAFEIKKLNIKNLYIKKLPVGKIKIT